MSNIGILRIFYDEVYGQKDHERHKLFFYKALVGEKSQCSGKETCNKGFKRNTLNPRDN